MAPGLRVFAVVEAEQQELAKAADLVVHPFDLFDDRGGRADQPIVLCPRLRRGCGVRGWGVDVDYARLGRLTNTLRKFQSCVPDRAMGGFR